MSTENRPNLNAVGLIMDIQDAVKRRIRGEAKNIASGDLLVLVHNIFIDAVEELDKKLDEASKRKEP